MATTLAQYRSAIASKVGLSNNTFGDQGFIDLWVNEGVTDVLMRTNCKMSSADLALTADTGDYELDTAILKIYDAYVNSAGQPYWMEQVTVEELLAMRRSSSASISPAQTYAVGGANLFMIYPTPASSSDTVTFYYIPRPTTLSVSSDTPSEIPAEYQKAVEYYALAQAADFADDTTTQMGASYQQQYELWIRKIKKWVQLKGHHRLPLATVRRNRFTIPYHDPSRY